MLVLIITWLIGIGGVRLFYFGDKNPTDPLLVVAVLPPIVVSTFVVNHAYRRGVSDARAHPNSDDATKKNLLSWQLMWLLYNFRSSRCQGTRSPSARDWSAAMVSRVARGAINDDSMCNSFAA